MDTLADIRIAVQDDLTVGDESTLYSPNLIDRAINRAYRKVGGLFPWPELQDAKKTSTQVNQEYYDYPQNWRSNSIWKIVIDDVRYGESPDGSPLSFDDYLNWKEDYPDSTDKKWANQWRRFFVRPVPTAQGSNNLHVWGIKVVSTLANDGDDTVFSYSTPEANEAIELEAVAILKSKGDQENASQFRSAEAKQILIGAWARISKENAKYEKDQPFFDVPDYFGSGNSKDLRGRFDI
jgi:hypothetical protein